MEINKFNGINNIGLPINQQKMKTINFIKKILYSYIYINFNKKFDKYQK